MMENTDYTISFESSRSPEKVFEALLDVRHWWSGLYGEEIAGESRQVNDEFTFHAGEGMHYSKQKLVELVPGKKLVWEVIDSNLSFLEKEDEWTSTKFGFELSGQDEGTNVTFTHKGLLPQIECFNNCSNAWTAYMHKLAAELK
ncbi:MAG: hypothetical protein K0S09_1482 [Sphingobacteriaceae bacterium]|nr:hypothetical protein [Sphingobacteriaceae bacterium]